MNRLPRFIEDSPGPVSNLAGICVKINSEVARELLLAVLAGTAAIACTDGGTCAACGTCNSFICKVLR